MRMYYRRRVLPWCFRLGPIIASAFVLATMTLSGRGEMRLVGMVFAAYGLYLLVLRRSADHNGRIQPELWWFTGWAIWSLLTGLVVCDYWVLYWHNAKILMQMVVMVWAGAIIWRHEKEDGHYAYFMFFVGACIQVLSCMMGYQNEASDAIGGGREILRESLDETTRLRGLTMNENALGDMMYIGVASVILLWNWKFLVPRWLSRTGLVAALPFFVFYTTRAGSRQTILVIGVLLVGWLLWVLPGMFHIVARQMFRVVAVASIIVFGGMAIGYMMEYTIVGERIRQHLDSGGVVGGAKENTRWDLYAQGFKMLADYPIAGVGLGHYVAHTATGHYSHSDYMEPLGCTGLVGFVLYHLWAGIIIWRLLRLRHVRGLTNEDGYMVRALILYMVTRYISGLFTPHWAQQSNQLLLAFISVETWKLGCRYQLHGRRRLRMTI